MNTIDKILEGIYENKELRRTIVPLFMSYPGQGKSGIIEEFMREKGVWKPPFVLSQRMPFEISGMALIDKEADKMKYFDFDFMLDLKDGDILFIDEVTNANPVTLNAFLTFIESRVMISGKTLPDIMIVGAGNYEGMAPLTPQIKERFMWYDVQFDRKMWETYIEKKYMMPSTISKKLSKIISEEKFEKLGKSNKIACNFNSARSIDKAINLAINSVPSPYNLDLELNTLITNPLDGVVVLKDDRKIEPNEQVSWLEIIKHMKSK